MNERIKELAVQAGAYLREGYAEQANGDSVWTKDVRIDHCDMDLQKFAELIIQDCADFIENTFDFCGDEIYAAEKIREHFRV